MASTAPGALLWKRWGCSGVGIPGKEQILLGYFQKLNGIPLPKVTPASALFPPKITRTSSHEPHGVFIFHFLFKGEALIPAEGIFFAKSPVLGRRVAITQGGSGEGTDQLQVKKGLNFLKVL